MLGKYEKGESEPSRDKLVAIAEAAGVDLLWLATGKGGMEPGAGQAVPKGEETIPFDEFVLVPRYNVEVSAGGGALVDGEEVVGQMAFRKDWVRKMGLRAKDLVLVTAKGDSMEPTLSDGDILLVDLGQTDIVDGAIHVIRNDGHLLAKRLQLAFNDKVIVRSDNTIYRELEIDRADLKVVGRAVWGGGKM